MKQLLNILFYHLFGLYCQVTRKKQGLIVFGSWMGQRYSDNTRFLAEFLAENEGFQVVYILDKNVEIDLPKNILRVNKNSCRSWLFIARAEYIFVTHGYSDISLPNVTKKLENIVQLWHGTPLKKIEDDNTGRFAYRFRENEKRKNKYLYYLSSSTEMTKALLTAFHSYSCQKENILEIGQPRNDFLIKNANNKERIAEIKEKYGIAKEAKLVTYMPTFRDDNSEVHDFQNDTTLLTLLEKTGYALVSKSHFAASAQLKTMSTNIINGSKFDTQELLLITDILITDYSSCYFDFAVMNRPIIHFAYDYEAYYQMRGMYYQLEEATPGMVVKDLVELYKYVSLITENIDQAVINNEKFHQYINFEQGNSCEQIMKLIQRSK
ncbi:MAG: CDP-glycerol glycerophosphotransferase family protein [Culicoidibacterales bacterium]